MENEKKGKTASFWKREKSYVVGFAFVLPALLGVLIFNLIPIGMSFVYGFSDYNVLNGAPTKFGFENYVLMFTTRSADFWQSIKVTGIYTILNVTITLVLSFLLALFLNREMKGRGVLRLIMYLPCLIPVVVSGMLWRDVTNVEYGVLNEMAFKLLGTRFQFLTAESSAMATLVFIGLFSLGGSMVLWIAQLNNIDPTLYEAADLDGASGLTKLFRITLPMCSPMIFYNLIMGVISSLQTFNIVYILAGNGGFGHKGLFFYVTNIYDIAFKKFEMGYAYALSNVLFLIIGLLTAVIFKTSRWVFYGEDS